MFHSALIVKCWRESRWLLAGCGTGLFAFCWLRVWLVSRLDTSRFKAILDLLPSDWLKFAPVEFDWLITYPGRISLAFSEPFVMLCLTIWAVARGSDAVSGELSRGTLELLLAQPVRRAELLLANILVTTTGCSVLACTAWSGTWVGIHMSTLREEVRPAWEVPFHVPGLGHEIAIPWAAKEIRFTPMHEKVDPRLFGPACLQLGALGICAAAFATLMSSWDRYRWRTIGIVVATILLQAVAKGTAMASEELRWLRSFTILTVYEPELVTLTAARHPDQLWQVWVRNAEGQIAGWGMLGALGLLLCGAIAMYALAGYIFCQRDLSAPV